MSSDLVQILEGNTFVVSDERGDIQASATDATGLFSFDTRFLSRWVLTVNGQSMSALSTDDLQYFQARFFLVPGAADVYVNADLTVIRLREVADGFHEELRVLNHRNEAADLEIRIEAASDFADLFEVKDALAKKGHYHNRVVDGNLVLGYQRETFSRETWICPGTAASVDENGLTFSVRVPAHGEWSTELDVVASLGHLDGPGEPEESAAHYARARGHRRTRPNMARGLEKWLNRAPRLECDWEPLDQIYRRCLTDLAALRFSPLTMQGRSLPAAGLPWFMTIFGRDSIFTSLQALPFASELAATTLQALAERQGTRIDDFRDEDPGRILHEQRFGELTAFEERPSRRTTDRPTPRRSMSFCLTSTSAGPETRSWSRTLSSRRERPSTGSTNSLTCNATATSPISAGTRQPGWRTSAGKTPGTRSPIATAICRGSRAPPVSCRATPTMPRCGPPGWPARSGGMRSTPTGWRRRQPI
jgi:glycogen debranching enzyme